MTERLISDEEIEEAFEHTYALDTPAESLKAARRIEALVRQRLAERLHHEAYQDKYDATHDRCWLRAARIVEGADER